MCATTAWPVWLPSVAVLYSDLQASFVKMQIKYHIFSVYDMFYISEYKVDQHQHRLLGSALYKDITVVTASPGTQNFSALSYLIEQYC